MARACSVCESPHRVAVDAGIVGGHSAHELGATYGLGERSIGRHKTTHLSRAMTAVAAKRAALGERHAATLTDRLEKLVGKIEDLVETSHRDGSAGQMLAAARELRACWELQAKLSGELTERPSVVVNVLASAEVQELTRVLIRALQPFPEARIVAADALDHLGVEVAP